MFLRTSSIKSSRPISSSIRIKSPSSNPRPCNARVTFPCTPCNAINRAAAEASEMKEQHSSRRAISLKYAGVLFSSREYIHGERKSSAAEEKNGAPRPVKTANGEPGGGARKGWILASGEKKKMSAVRAVYMGEHGHTVATQGRAWRDEGVGIVHANNSRGACAAWTRAWDVLQEGGDAWVGSWWSCVHVRT